MLKQIYSKIVNLKYKKKNNELKKLYPNSIISSCANITNATLEGANVVSSKASICNSYLGYGSIIGENTILHNCKIGKFCSISWNVHLSIATHPLYFVSTYPSFFNTTNNYPFGKGEQFFDEFLKTDDGYSVEIGNDVWIGESVIIKGGVKINDGAVIGMGAVVTKDVPPYAVIGGVPAKIIKFRFNEEAVNKLLKIKWWNWTEETIKARRKDFVDIETFIKKYGE